MKRLQLEKTRNPKRGALLARERHPSGRAGRRLAEPWRPAILTKMESFVRILSAERSRPPSNKGAVFFTRSSSDKYRRYDAVIRQDAAGHRLRLLRCYSLDCDVDDCSPRHHGRGDCRLRAGEKTASRTGRRRTWKMLSTMPKPSGRRQAPADCLRRQKSDHPPIDGLPFLAQPMMLPIICLFRRRFWTNVVSDRVPPAPSMFLKMDRHGTISYEAVLSHALRMDDPSHYVSEQRITVRRALDEVLPLGRRIATVVQLHSTAAGTLAVMRGPTFGYVGSDSR